MKDKEQKDLQKHNEFVNRSIPISKRKPLWIMIIIMAGFSIFSATIWVGADIANSFKMIDLIWIILVGNILLTIYIALLGYVGGQTGLSTHMLSQRIFGKHGYKLTSMLTTITQLGWFGVGLMMFVIPVSKVLGVDQQPWIVAIILIVAGVAMISSAFVGIRALTWVSAVSVPLVIIFGFIMMAFAISSTHGANWNPTPGAENPYTSMEAIGLVFATFVSGGTLAPDFVRWAKNGKHAVLSIVFSFLLFSTLMLIFGAFSFYGTGQNDLSDALIIMGMAVPGVLVLGANIWTTNDNGLYTQGLAVGLIFNIPKRRAILILGAIGVIMAPLFNAYFVPFLNILNYLIPGIGTLIILNEFCFKQDNSNLNVNWYGISAWALGIALALIFQIFVWAFIIPLYAIGFTSLIFIGLNVGRKLIAKQTNKA